MVLSWSGWNKEPLGRAGQGSLWWFEDAYPFVVGKPQWQWLKGEASTVRQQGEMKAGAQLTLCFSYIWVLSPQYCAVHIEGDFFYFNVLSLETEES